MQLTGQDTLDVYTERRQSIGTLSTLDKFSVGTLPRLCIEKSDREHYGNQFILCGIDGNLRYKLASAISPCYSSCRAFADFFFLAEEFRDILNRSAKMAFNFQINEDLNKNILSKKIFLS